MKAKSVFIIIATLMCALSLWSGVFRVNVDRSDRSGSAIILKIEKYSKGGIAIDAFYQKTSEVIREAAAASSERIRGSVMAQRYNEQPMLYGILLIFFAASACIASFVIHMLRSDPRFQ